MDLGAPGVNVYSCQPGGIYQYLSGTSMATPHVAGASALVWSVNPNATASSIKQAVLDGAEQTAALSNRCVTGGRLNIFNAMQKLEQNVALTPASGISASGFCGGPFNPPAGTYTISNIGTNSFLWTAAKTATWLDLSLTNGSLFPGQSNAVIVAINAATANALAVGTYSDTLTFSNTASVGVQVRTISLTVRGEITFDPDSYTVGEADGTVLISVRRSGNTNRLVTVNFAASNGTAMAGNDYVATNGTLVFAAGDTVTNFTVSILNDSLTSEGNESVILTLSNPIGGGTLGEPNTASLMILDDDVDTHYVSLTGGNVAPYTNWAMAATSIQPAVNAAISGDVVRVAAGTHVLSSRISVPAGITIQGAGESATIVDGNNAVGCFSLAGNAGVAAMTITRGYVVEGFNGTDGGGVTGGVVSNCTLSGNRASYGGGGADHSTLYNCTLSSNSAGISGGGVWLSTLYNCIITGNSAKDQGGGAYYSTLYNCTLSGNSVVTYPSLGGAAGGTLYNSILYPDSQDSTLYNCWTNNPKFVGGGDYSLRFDSPCIGTANPLTATASDIRGIARDPFPDIGAFEYNQDIYYTLTVNGGTGDGIYTNGQMVVIAADVPASGKVFDRWIGDTQYVNNVTYTNALVTMPAQAVNLTATYVDAYYALTVTGGTGSGTYTNQQQVTITADVPTSGQIFDRWSGATQYVASSTSSTTTVTMPAEPISLAATYKDIDCILTVISAHGTPTPSVGTNVYPWGTIVTCSVNNVAVEGATNWICSGWTGTGDVTSSGDGHTTGAILLTNLNSSITWNWPVATVSDLRVENVNAAQRPGTTLVDISYDVFSTKTNAVEVSLAVLNGTQTVNAATASGAVGSGVAAGTGNSIVWDAGMDWNSNLAALTIRISGQDTQGAGILTPSGRVRIPAGMNSGTDPDTGAYSITITNAFFIDASETTKTQWDTVYVWALTNGYTFSNSGSGTVTNHPVHTVSWYDAVKWCNARSQMEGFTSCYNTNDLSCDVNANGYRLPTSAEWQYAARGGLSGRRFPWGNTIAHSNANYYSSASYPYDVSPTRGFHRVYGAGTAPEGSGSTNGYGLYAMAGNVMEWCGDASGANRALSGGSWNQYASEARCAYTGWDSPLAADDTIGFRTVQRASSSTSTVVLSAIPVDTRDYLLVVSSKHGTPAPNVGTNRYAWRATVTSSVQSIVSTARTNWTSAGWSGSGSVPESGTLTNTGGFMLTGLVSSINWGWNTNYWLGVYKAGHGSVSTSGGWMASGTNIQVTATPDTFYHFTGWSGDVTTNSTTLTLMMSRPRTVTGNFAPNITANTETPEWWLAQYGLTNFNADVLTDLDLDGVKTWEEYIAGTDPTNRNSMLLVDCNVLPNGRRTLSWFGIQGRVYTLEYIVSLQTNNWKAASFESPGAGTVISITDAQLAPKYFYRVRVRVAE